MSASLLREAAALMRERAEYAKPGPWSYLSSAGRSNGGESVTYVSEDLETALTVECGPDGGATFDCTHFTSWHPAVALAVADLLEAVAHHIDKRWTSTGDAVGASAVTVATAYLNTEVQS